MLKDKVWERQPKTHDELCEVILEEWWAIPQGYIAHLFDTMEERFRRLKANNGGRFRKVN